MTFRDRVAEVLAFRTWPTTIVALLIYAAIYTSILVTDDLPSIPSPKRQHGVDLDAAYRDLHYVAGGPHPYNSHRNDDVRTYILSRAESNAKKYPYVHVDDDITSNATWAQAAPVAWKEGGFATYFEGNNVLIRIDGSKPELKGVLFSAHFDSVSTAPGATDDGMGVVTLLQLVDYFAQNQPKRTVVFNINNGEEDGLMGAHAFLEHPWFELSNDFINLEGAGAGGRPLLLRTTSTRLARSFARAAHPLGNVISADAFKRGVVKSGTDYSVYTDAAMEGLDFTFFKPRSKYHTKKDSIPSLGGKAALWNMLESSLLAGKALVDDEGTGGGGSAVYFDLFGEALAVFSLQTFFIVNIVLLVVGPILVTALIFTAYKQRKLYWSSKGWGRFIVAVIVSGVLTFGLGVLYTHINPLIIYTSPGSVMISCLTLSYISFYLTLELFTYLRPIPQQKAIMLLEAYILWWAFLVADTVLISNVQLGGLYFVTFFHVATLTALVIGLLEQFELPAGFRRRRLLPPRIEVHDEANGANEHENDEEHAEADAADERTPLIQANGQAIKDEDLDEDNVIGLWFLQFLLAVPFPVILITEIGVMLLAALGQTLADGSKPLTVYLAVSFVAFLSILPAVPFLHKFHRSLFGIFAFVLAFTAFYNFFAFPFSSSAPLKVFFQQTIDLNTGNTNVSLTGVQPWVMKYIIPEIPSSWGTNVTCTSDTLRAGLPSCTWPALSPAVAPGHSKNWLKFNATLTSPGSARITIRGSNTRNCRLYFSPSTRMTNIHVPLYPLPRDGVSELRLWSREWERTFEVHVAWDGSEGVEGRVACEWAESDGAAIPALDEVMAFLPDWARVTKRTDGLVEGYKRFKL
ncbi:Zn-dependent exopeptidase [Rickenella mellea]|uniref:Peptide hydrolase n=1 Tax=Rickenella mellea TaxID=50990 RepID=A0A4Y7QEQ0_9AGAM|nr:Zn-dependent exopeptidase [Rickenella mellea]